MGGFYENMKKRITSLLLSFVLALSLGGVCYAADFEADSEGRYTFEYTAQSPDTDYIMIVVAGDYTEKDAPEISADNVIYINQVTSDADGKISFSDFIPLTGSVGTVFVSSENIPENAGRLITDSGFGYVAGRLISYSGNRETVTIPSEFTSVESGAFAHSESTKNVIIANSAITLARNAFAVGIKLFFSPVANAIKQYAADAGYAYRVLGDFDGDGETNMEDMTGILGYFANKTEQPSDFSIYFDLDMDGSVTLRDVSTLLKYLGGIISDFFD